MQFRVKYPVLRLNTLSSHVEKRDFSGPGNISKYVWGKAKEIE